MRIALTGVTGGLGSQLIMGLESRFPEWGCVGLARPEFDLRDPEKVFRVIMEISPDLIIHPAAMTNVDRCETEREEARAVNVEGTRGLARAAEALSVPLVYVSTDYVFNGEKGGAYTEKDMPDPVNVYGETKLEGERIVSGLKHHLIVRSSWLYGPAGHNFVKTMLRLGEGGGSVRVVADQTGAPTCNVDLAEAIIQAVYKEIRGVLHITNTGFCSWMEFARAIFEEKEMNVEVVPISSKDLDRPAARPKNSRLDCSRFEDLAHMRMRHWREALKEFLRGA